MKKTIYILPFILLMSFNSLAASKVRISVSNVEFTTGLNETTNQPLPGSDWQVKLSFSGAGSCAQFEDEGYIYDHGEKVTPITVNIAASYNDCQSVRDLYNQPEYENVVWEDLGLVQSSDNGIEQILCGIGKECDIYQETVEREEVFTVINPTPGVRGTDAGYADIFSFKVFDYEANNEVGIGGVGGKADLPSDLDNIRYCVKLRDALTDGTTSIYASNPELSIHKINWRPIVQGPDANDGNNPITTQKKKKTSIVQGLDHVTRSVLSDQIIVNGFDFSSDSN